MRFSDWAKKAPNGKAIVLDIDGTLVSAGQWAPPPGVVAAVERLKKDNDVFLFSNKNIPTRNGKVAEALDVPLLDSSAKKPFPRVLENLPSEKPLVVVGDKFLTDGLLAYFTGSEFVHVARVSGTGEPLMDKTINAVDDAFWYTWNLFLLLRPGQWVKNVLVFAPLFFARRFLEDGLLGQAMAAFVAFCFLASAGYCINDLQDRLADALHPRKRFRPIASGAVPPLLALIFAALLVLVAALIIATYIPAVALLAALYLLSSFLYSAYLKRVPVLEMLFFVWFYLARTLAGGLAVSVPISSWLILAIVFLALFLVCAKRYAESRSGRSRAVLAYYPEYFLQGMLVLSAALVVVFYALYTVLGLSLPGHLGVLAEAGVAGAAFPLAVYSTLPVLGAIMRYLQLSFGHTSDNTSAVEYPEKLILKDPGLLLAALAWLAMMVAVFY